jgi:hypothetical protein
VTLPALSEIGNGVLVAPLLVRAPFECSASGPSWSFPLAVPLTRLPTGPHPFGVAFFVERR